MSSCTRIVGVLDTGDAYKKAATLLRLLDPEDGATAFLSNIDNYVPVNMA
jgi:hypothetical protein